MLGTNNTCLVVIMGATGDLTKRKLIPAIYKLIKNNSLGRCAFIGAARDNSSANEILERSRKYIKNVDEKVWLRLSEVFSYTKLDFSVEDEYKNLKSSVEQQEKKWGLSGNRIFYLATMPELFSEISKHLCQAGIVRCSSSSTSSEYLANSPTSPWYRVVYEKPFGRDIVSSRKINEKIVNIFSEDQIFRVDHYLCKELVGNIVLSRFTNLFFQPLWNNKYIESVQLILNESIDIEGRGEFYENYGVVKDVVQNHLLQLVSLIAMEAPNRLSGNHIRDAKVSVLKDIQVEDSILGQYSGYKKESGVKSDSKVPTFAALKLTIKNERWSGVPFYLKSGKAMPHRVTAIHIKFRQPVCLLSKNCPADSNYLTIAIEPENSMYLEINAKVPGKQYEITPVKMEFCHNELFGPNTPQAYETLLRDVVSGDQSAFVRFDEIDLSWKIVDDAIKLDDRIFSYEKGSSGPPDFESWSRKNGVRWRA